MSEEHETENVRKLPRFIDIFFFPISVSSLTILGIYMFSHIALYLLGLIRNIILSCVPFFSMPFVLLFAAIELFFLAYMFWYFGMCIHESALGAVRAPETLNKSNAEGTSEMIFGLLRIASCILICVGPSLTYYSIINSMDWICWLLLVFGPFFLPMSLLATVMFDSLCGLNPILIISSTVNTFFQYCLFLSMFCVPVGIVVIVSICFPKDTIGIVGYVLRGINSLFTFATGLPISLPEHTTGITCFILRGVYAYLIMVAAHLLGRFYWKYQEKLNWEV